MNGSTLACKDEVRRQLVRAHTLGGLDYVEVDLLDSNGKPAAHPKLTVNFLGKAPQQKIVKDNVTISGGRRIPGSEIKILSADVQTSDDPELDDTLVLIVDKSGDFSVYTLSLIEIGQDGHPTGQPLPGLDQRYASVDFSFKAQCSSDLDCKLPHVCAPEVGDQPEIDYLAKDYSSFRQLILDRLSLIMPDWTERHVPDIGIALVEILAYVGDHLSYYQDAVATEAYLQTARQRISVRRHVRLVDYLMHEGCNARAWVAIETDSDLTLKASDMFFFTGLNSALRELKTVMTVAEWQKVTASSYEIFEPVVTNPDDSINLYVDNSKILFYTWGNEECCLPIGATSATLLDAAETSPQNPTPQNPPGTVNAPSALAVRQPAVEASSNLPPRILNLKIGDVLIFEEMIGPKTGDPSDADPNHRYAVRLTKVTPGVDKLLNVPVVDIEWSPKDALPFALCISAIGPAPACELIDNVSVARGNVILVDNGQTIKDEDLGQVPVIATTPRCDCPGEPSEIIVEAVQFRPVLKKTPLTFCQPATSGPASESLTQDPRAALPQVKLSAIPAVFISPNGYAPLFQMTDISNPTQLAEKLKAAKDPLSQQLRGWLSSDLLQLLDNLAAGSEIPTAILNKLAGELTTLLSLWIPQVDLFESYSRDRHFVVEIDNDGHGHLRFGDGEMGQSPAPGSQWGATYRAGCGHQGNVGPESISHVVFRQTLSDGILRVRNPLPAVGGIDPEPIDEVKLFAPHNFRDQLERAITSDDYAALSTRDSLGALQQSGASLNWTGSWYEARVEVDPLGSETPAAALLQQVDKSLYRYRRIGHDLDVRTAIYVPLDIELSVCVDPDYLRAHVAADLLDVFSNRALPNGKRGFFHPDNLTFGDGVYLSALVAAAQAVDGVRSVDVTRMKRLFAAPNHEIENGILPLTSGEIAQLDNDPNYPEHGKLALVMRGGR